MRAGSIQCRNMRSTSPSGSAWKLPLGTVTSALAAARSAEGTWRWARRESRTATSYGSAAASRRSTSPSNSPHTERVTASVSGARSSDTVNECATCPRGKNTRRVPGRWRIRSRPSADSTGPGPAFGSRRASTSATCGGSVSAAYSRSRWSRRRTSSPGRSASTARARSGSPPRRASSARPSQVAARTREPSTRTACGYAAAVASRAAPRAVPVVSVPRSTAKASAARGWRAYPSKGCRISAARFHRSAWRRTSSTSSAGSRPSRTASRSRRSGRGRERRRGGSSRSASPPDHTASSRSTSVAVVSRSGSRARTASRVRRSRSRVPSTRALVSRTGTASGSQSRPQARGRGAPGPLPGPAGRAGCGGRGACRGR